MEVLSQKSSNVSGDFLSHVWFPEGKRQTFEGGWEDLQSGAPVR